MRKMANFVWDGGVAAERLRCHFDVDEKSRLVLNLRKICWGPKENESWLYVEL